MIWSALSLALFLGKNVNGDGSAQVVSPSYGTLLTSSFDLEFRGGEYVCIEAYAKGTIQQLNASVAFTTTTVGETSLNFVAGVKFKDANTGDCIQVGGFVETCRNLYTWDTTWYGTAESGNTYKAVVDVSGANYNWPSGTYQLCFGDGSPTSTNETYIGTISYADLTYEPENTVEVASPFGEIIEIDINAQWNSQQYDCVTTYASGNLNQVYANIDFTSASGTPGDVGLAVIINYATSAAGECIQVGGSSELCSYVVPWPAEWYADAVSGTYEAYVDISGSGLVYPEGSYQFCFGNGEQIDTGYNTYAGVVQVNSLINEPALYEISSAPGETLTLDFNVAFDSFEYTCLDTYVNAGQVKFFNTTLLYTSTNIDQVSTNFVAVLKYATSIEAGDCIQIGGNIERCNNFFSWPAAWYTDAQRGVTYQAVVDVSSANYKWDAGEYQICVGNSQLEDASVTFIGNISFPDLTSAVQPLEITSEVGEVLEVSFDVAFTGGDYLCIDTAASSKISYVNASVFFTTTSTEQDSLDFVAIIKFATAITGDCIQIGKFNFFGGSGERCNHLFLWPENWNAGAKSGQLYTAIVDVSSANYSWPAGIYQLCVGDGNTLNTYDTYKGSMQLPNLINEADNVITLANSPGEIVDVDFAVEFQGGEYVCLDNILADGQQIIRIDTSLVFTTNDPAQTSVDFVAVIKFKEAETGQCILIGTPPPGINIKCEYNYQWPDEWYVSAQTGKTYTASIDVSAANYKFDGGAYGVCVGDSGVDSTTYDSYVGHITFPNLTSVASKEISLASSPGEVVDVDFNVEFEGGEYVCLDNILADGQQINRIDTSLVFTTEDPAQTSVDFVAVIKYKAAETGQCILIGTPPPGINIRCEYTYQWPDDWYESAESGKTYTASIDVSAANYTFAGGAYGVCVGDSGVDSTTFDSYVGHITFPNLTSVLTFAPSASPTAEINKKSNDDDSEALSTTNIILIAVLVPVGVILIGAVVYFFFFVKAGKGAPLLANQA
jgi:hypothetical protein